MTLPRAILLVLAMIAGTGWGFAQRVADGIDLSTPRIKSGGLAIWVGNTPYRDCLLEDVSLNGETVTFSSRSGTITVPWKQIAAQSRTQLQGEYNALLAEKTKVAEAMLNPKPAKAATPAPAEIAAPAQPEEMSDVMAMVKETLGAATDSRPRKIHVMVAKVIANNSVIGERYEPGEAGGAENLTATGKMVFLKGLTEAPPSGKIVEVTASREADLNGSQQLSLLPASVEVWVAQQP